MTIKKVNGIIKQIIAAVLAGIMMVSSPVSALAQEAVKTSNYVISKLDSAQSALESLANSRAIMGAIYLKDSYIMKSEASPYSEDIAAIASGQTVNIIGVDVDEGRNIWYKVSYSYAGGELKGYIEREFIACSDERFLQWEDKYITTTNRESIRNTSDCSDIEQFPESYRDALYELKKTHPNWTFVRQNVGIDWNTALYQEGMDERSLISGSADSSFRGEKSKKTAGWYIATPGIIAYYMDPRNFLDESYIFMFELQSYNAGAHTTAAVQSVLDGTFMSGYMPDAQMSYAQAFVNIGSSQNLSPIALAARVRQEQGVQGTSPMISGTYPGYEGYYNYFNISANGPTNEEIFRNGLQYAKSQGWNTRTKSLAGGASKIANNYIKRGQDTGYLQKFDVDASDGTLYTHQYMQNISAPYSEARSTYNSYKNGNILNGAFVFKIPVYDNMPSGKCIKPNATDVITLDVEQVENLPVDQNAVVISLINGGQNNDAAMVFSSSDENVAKVDNNGVITGIRPGMATIYAKRAENTTNTASCKVVVIKADIALSSVKVPEINVTYSEGQKLKDIELPASFSWLNGDIVPTVENEGYSVIYSPDNSRYNAITMTIPVNVERAETENTKIKLPENLTIDAGAELSTVVLPGGFTWTDATVTAPKKTGNYQFDAYYCEDPANYKAVPVKITVKVVCKSHDYSEWTGEHAGCGKEGRLVRTCTICGHEEELREDALEHSYVGTVTKEPTTTETGIRTYVCSRCQDKYTEDIPKLEESHTHSYSEQVTREAGCLTEGEKTFTCACGDSYTEIIEALGHDYDENNVCRRCGYKLQVVPEHIHDFTLSGCTATCTEDGEKIYMCGCGENYREPAVKLGHDVKNGACTRCDYVIPTPSPTAAPSPTVAITPTTAPTATAAPSPTVAVTPTAAPTVTAAPSPTVAVTPTAAPTATAVPSPTVAVTPTAAPTATAVPSKAVAVTPTVVPSKASMPTVAVKEITPTAEVKHAEAAVEEAKEEETAPAVAVTPAKQTKAETPNDDTLKQNVEPLVTKEKDNYNPGTTPAAEDGEEQPPIEVVMMSSTILDADKIKEYISEDNKKLNITLANDVVWEIDLTDADIENINMDLGIAIGSDIDNEYVEEIAKDNPIVAVSLNYDGAFGFKAKIHIPVNKEYAGKYANLYYINPKTGKPEFVQDVIIGENGEAVFDFEHASDYAIVIADASLNPETANKEAGGEDEEGILITSGMEGFMKNNMNMLYFAIGILGVVFIASMGCMIVVRVKRRKDDDYYFDEED